MSQTPAAISPRVARLAELIREARSVVALTGAGISVPSGIPDFRTPGTGLWANVDPMEVAHIDAWRADPARFWTFYGERFAALEDKRPNGAHEALVELERRGKLDAVITQNVDMLHRKAGSGEVVEVHGTIEHSSCLRCREPVALSETRSRLRAASDGVPRCSCGQPLKPDVVLFGELLPDAALVAGSRAGAGRRRAALRRQLARGPSGRAAAGRDAARRRRDRARDAGPDAVRRAWPRSSCRATSSPSCRRSSRRSRPAGDGRSS